jgi:O-antigen/teichoic acid export membrane protein
MDKIMLGILANISEVGYYENAEKIVQVPLAVITALGTVLLPRASNMISNNKEKELKELIEKTMPFVIFLAMPMTLGIIAISKNFSILFFGQEFEKSGIIMQLLAITIIFLSWGNVIRTQYLIPKERDKEYIISAFLGAIINFIINYLLIPKYASIGACIGTIIAEFTVMLYQSIVVSRELPLKKYIRKSIKFVYKSAIMFFVILIIGKYIENDKVKILLQVTGGIIIYLLLNKKYILNELDIKRIFEKILNKTNKIGKEE